MNQGIWKPLRPTERDFLAVGEDVAAISDIQKRTLTKCPHLHVPDRVAHQYQIAGSKVTLHVESVLPPQVEGVGLFQPGADYIGIGRISTGLGTPHNESDPDFLGLRLAFQSRPGRRVDFLSINDPTSPADDHHRFMQVLQATGDAAGAEAPHIGSLPDVHLADLAVEQTEFALALAKRIGLAAAPTLFHLTRQTIKATLSSTAWQTYWTGIEEINSAPCKFTLLPERDENHRPGLHPGGQHLTGDWRARQSQADVLFRLYWIPYLDENQTPTTVLTTPWHEDGKQLIGTVCFPRQDPASADAHVWAILANEMGASPANWVHDRDDTISEPSTEFGLARKLAYQNSQQGRSALEPSWYESAFSTGVISPELGAELNRRQTCKDELGHIGFAR
jgi:hypothetical protein